MMIVFFKRITYRNRPLLWELQPDKNSAVCLYQVIKKDGVTKYNQKAIDSSLEQIKGVVFEKKAIIADLDSFTKTYSLSEVESPILTVGKRNPNRFFPASLHALQSTSQDCKTIKAASFDQLMEKYAGSTTCYNSLYRSSDIRLKQILKLEIITDTRLAILMDMYKDQFLYKLRSHQVDTLRLLFDKVLLPAIYAFFEDEEKSAIPEPLALYLQEAVIMALSNDPSNTQATSFERQQEDDPFIKNEWYSHQAYAAREERAEGKLKLLAFFLNDETLAKDLVDENLALCLEEIRSKMTKGQRDEVRTLFHEMKHLILEVGILKYSNDLVCSEKLVKTGQNCIPEVEVSNLFRAVNDSRTSPLFDAIFKDSPFYSDVLMDETVHLPVYYSLLEMIRGTLNANKAKPVKDIIQHAKSLFGSIADKIYSQERKDPSNSEDNLTDKTINTTTLGIYLAESTYQELNQRLQAYRAPRINKQKHLNEFIIDTVLNIYLELRQGVERSVYNPADSSRRPTYAC